MKPDKAFFQNLAERVIAEMPLEDRFTEADAAEMARHKDFLLSLEGELVQSFYDSLFAHSATAKVFHEGERPAREETLRTWWRRTVEGPFDADYWSWQAYVGLVHVRRKVTNTMMLGHAGLVARLVAQKAVEAGRPELVGPVTRLMATVGALVVAGYEEVHWAAVEDMTGQSRALIEKSVEVAVEAWDK